MDATRIESGRVHDLRVDGARLESARPLPPGTTDIYIGIFLAADEAPLVARARAADDGTLEFLAGGRGQRESIVRISDYLEERAAGRAV